MGTLSEVSWKKSGSFFCHPTATGIYNQKLSSFIFLELELRTVWSSLGLGSLAPKVSLPIFIHHTWMWDYPLYKTPPPLCATPGLQTSLPISASPPLLPTWVNAASLNPWLSDYHIAWFSNGSGCYLFWGLDVILSVVTWGGEACLPTSPSWLEFFHF